MLKQLHQSIEAHIQANLPQIKWIDIWNNQPARYGEDFPWPRPAIFLEYQFPDFETQGKGVQKTDAVINVYITQDLYAGAYTGAPNQTAALAVLDMIDTVHAAMQGFSDDSAGLGALDRQSLTPDTNHGNLVTYSLTYQARVTDASAIPPTEEVTPTTELQDGPKPYDQESNFDEGWAGQ